ncbi:MAG: ABC transporter permease [Phycisphaerae bacterium]|nr:ABC transporter permease [Phycisphaerae bacterium]NUQ44492.1 ABC transporter permease [Phycisphaerae bacterium]
MALPLRYNWRNIFARRFSTVLTFGVVAVVVAVLVILLSFSEGIRISLTATGSPRNIVVIKPGATAESTSILFNDELALLEQTPGLHRDMSGRAWISRERCLQTSIPRVDVADRPANVAIRAIDEIAFDLHEEVRLIEGRRFARGSEEVIVGKAARDRYAGLNIGDEVALGRLANRRFRVVGIFEARGSALESEIWADYTAMSSAYEAHFYSSAMLRLSDPAVAEAAIAHIRGPAVELEAKTETQYYKDLSQQADQIAALTIVLVSIMAFGAVFAVANTLYAAVDARRREIAMLRTIGFSRGSVIGAFVIESLMICGAACAVGLAVSLVFDGARQDYLSDTTWTVLAYELKVTPRIVAIGLMLAMCVGVIGAVAPAWRASRVGIIEALRKA